MFYVFYSIIIIQSHSLLIILVVFICKKTRYLSHYQLRQISHQLHQYRVAIKPISTVMDSAYTRTINELFYSLPLTPSCLSHHYLGNMTWKQIFMLMGTGVGSGGKEREKV